MPSSFTISTNQSTLELDAQRHAEATFTVNNVSGRALRGRAVLKPADKSIESWLKLDGESERNFMIADQQTYKLLIDAPVKAGPGTYPLQFNMVGVAVPEDDLTEGPTVSFKVVAAKPAPNLMPLIIAGVGLMLLAIIAVVIFAVNSGNNAAALAATGTANAGGTVVAQATRDALSAATAAASATNVVLRATQDAQATAGAAGTAAVGTAQAVQKTVDAQATSVAAQKTADGQATTVAAQKTAVAAQQTADAQAAAKYNGDWIKSNTSPAGVKELVISSSGQNVTLKATADYRDFLTANGGWASQACNPGCSWGEVTVAFDHDPLAVTLPLQSGLAHVLTLALSGNQLSVADQTKINGITRFTAAYIFSSSCSRFNCVIEVRPLPSVICAITNNC